MQVSSKAKTKPEVFIVESLTLDDEKERRQEGDLLSRMLHIAGKAGTEYYYIRTRRELEEIIDLFDESECRYLHISCHANRSGMATTFDDISYRELGEMLKPCLEGRRVFVSACQMATAGFAKEILPSTGCNSLIGPKRSINFDDAAAFWVSFYHLMFKLNERSMKREGLRKRIKQLSGIYEEPINYYVPSSTLKTGYEKIA
jgi:hypothetical protein